MPTIIIKHRGVEAELIKKGNAWVVEIHGIAQEWFPTRTHTLEKVIIEIAVMIEDSEIKGVRT
jgi:hypothetical protein